MPCFREYSKLSEESIILSKFLELEKGRGFTKTDTVRTSAVLKAKPIYNLEEDKKESAEIAKTNKFSIDDVLKEFALLNKILDKKIQTSFKTRVQLKSHTNSPATSPARNVTSKRCNKILEQEKKIESLEAALERQKMINLELQNEFNKILDEKENEQENANTEVT